MDILRERKINKLADELYQMAKSSASESIDRDFTDLAASRLVDVFAERLIRFRASQYLQLYGKPEDEWDRKKADRFIIGEGYHEFLAKNQELVKKYFKAFLKDTKIILSGITTKEGKTHDAEREVLE